MERMIPCNPQAEQGVLGSILIDPGAYDKVSPILSPEDFNIDAHRTIYEAILKLNARRVAADHLTLCDELERTEKLNTLCYDNVTGSAYLNHLTNCVPHSGNALYYAGILKILTECRHVIGAAAQMAQIGYMQEPGALEKSEQLLFKIRAEKKTTDGFVGMPTMMNEYMDELDYLHNHRGSISGVPTGYSDLDLCLGGLQKSDLILLAARPSMGKTALALCIGYNAALKGKKVAIFSLEMGRRLLSRRLMSMSSKVDMQRLRNGWIEGDEWEKITNSYQDLSQLPVWVNDTAGNPIASMRSELRRLSQEHGEPDLVIVDYIGLIEPDIESDKKANLVQQISETSRGLKSLAKEFDVPMLSLCQLSRAVEQRSLKIPILSDLRDSGSLEQDADVVMFIYRDDYYAMSEKRESETPNQATIYIAKHRNGPTGEVNLWWQADQTMFYNLTDAPKNYKEINDDE
jgi:replicative DNA helicase